jgi:hypothetical protein
MGRKLLTRLSFCFTLCCFLDAGMVGCVTLSAGPDQLSAKHAVRPTPTLTGTQGEAASCLLCEIRSMPQSARLPSVATPTPSPWEPRPETV